ncbi:MAG: DUF3089 domain-containing protein [Spirochaetota bacterium]
MIRPGDDFASQQHPPAPDYANETTWAALPWRQDLADKVPVASLKDGQKFAKVDVFFIHPTTFFRRDWNAPLDHEKTNTRTDKYTIQMQASAYNCCGRIFAPRYRQATLFAFLDKKESGKKALQFAYVDIKKAFQHYLAKWNEGRGIVIASHSQGSFHAIRLLQDFFDTPEKAKQLVVAYTVGMAISEASYKHLKACKSADETGCIVSYRTIGEGFAPKRLLLDPPGKGICTNPLSWKTGSEWANMKLHLGGVTRKFKQIDKQLTSARCREDGYLEIKKPNSEGYKAHRGGDYHTQDYSLFYMNLRENVHLRVESFLKTAK